MNRILDLIKYLLLLIVLFLNILFVKDIGVKYSINYIIYYLLFIIILIVTIVDIIKKTKIYNKIIYNDLCVITYTFMIYILFMTIYARELILNNRMIIDDEAMLFEFAFSYFEQNLIFINIMLFLILLFRIISKNK